MCSAAFGTEFYTVPEGLLMATPKLLRGIDRPPDSVKTLNEIKALCKKRFFEGHVFWAFGSAVERELLEIPVNDL